MNLEDNEMHPQITQDMLKRFKENYDSNNTNKIIENAITRNGLEKACINRDIILENQPVFNIEVPESKRYDQKDSWKCWIYSGLNVIKHNIAKNLNIDIMKLELSCSYIAFYDKLEKSNNIYETIIKLENLDFDYLHKEKILDYCVTEGGYWQMFLAIINKYGIMPYAYYPDTKESHNYEKVEYLYTEKVKKDILKLIDLRKKNTDLEMLEQVKKQFLEENYTLLSKIYGEIVTEFDYEYRDKNGDYHRLEKLTPLEFKNKFMTLNLDDYVTIANMPTHNQEFYKMYTKKGWNNVYINSQVKYLNLPIEDLKELAIKQLKDGIPVYMGAHIRKFRDFKTGILDTRLYNYENSLGFKRLSKSEALNLYDISMHHSMAFAGVNIVDGKPQRWKIEDSYGDEAKVNGYYIMNDNFFDDFVKCCSR